MNKGTDIDEILITVGVCGRWQILQLTSLLLNALHCNHANFFIVNIGYTPPHRCKIPSQYNDTLVHQGSCSLLNVSSEHNTSCLYGYEYDIYVKDSSIVSKWDLVCDQDYLSQLSQTLYMLGQFFGGCTFTFVSDRQGRKTAYLISIFVLAIVEILMSFSPNIAAFIAGRFIVGLCIVGMASSAYILTIELFPQSKSQIIGPLNNLSFAVGSCITALVGFVFQYTEWYWSTLLYGVASFTNIYQIWILDESIRWLFAKGKNKKASEIMYKASRLNKTSLQNMDKLNSLILGTTLLTAHKTEVMLRNRERPSLSVTDIMKHPRLRLYSLMSMFLWSSTYLSAFALILMSNQLHGNRYLNLFLIALFMLISKILMVIIINRFDRKRLLFFWLSCSAVTFVIIAPLETLRPDLKVVVTVCSIIGCFCLSNCISILWVFTPELYPTKLRTIGLGTAQSSSALISLAAPFVSYVYKQFKWFPGTLFAAMCLISLGLLVFLPETSGKSLMQTMTELEQFDDDAKDEEQSCVL